MLSLEHPKAVYFCCCFLVKSGIEFINSIFYAAITFCYKFSDNFDFQLGHWIASLQKKKK